VSIEISKNKNIPIFAIKLKGLKKILKYISSFIKEDFNGWIYGFTFLFLILSISFNYSVNFEKKILGFYYLQPIGILYCFIFYALAYYIIAIPKLLINKSNNVISNYQFWTRSSSFLLLLALLAGFNILNTWATAYNGYEAYYITKISANLRFVVIFLIPLFIIWKVIDKKHTSFYGLTLKNLDLKPYFLMLLIMFPLIALASTQGDFLATYPKFKPWFPQGDVFGLTKMELTFIYEITYAFNFISLELFFRGALVISMVAIIGKHAVLPMAVTYCFLHFGKPLAECISSFFGGYLLGVIAFYTRSIVGGCIVHMGIAFMMEIAALIQHYFILKK